MTDRLAGGDVMRLCPDGEPNPLYSCRFCHVPIHRHDECECSVRRETTHYASLYVPCAEALDLLTAGSVLGRVHKALVRESWFNGRGPSDDA